MRYFHTTSAAGEILKDGFRDASGSVLMASFTLTGVYIADEPLDINDGAKGDQVLEVTFPGEVDLAPYELVEECKPYREWCVPAELLSRCAAVRLLKDDEAEQATPRRLPPQGLKPITYMGKVAYPKPEDGHDRG